MPRRSTSELRDAACELALDLLQELRGRRSHWGAITTPHLIGHIQVLADYGGLPPAAKAWEAAMHALASQHTGEETKKQILVLLAGLANPAIEEGK